MMAEAANGGNQLKVKGPFGLDLSATGPTLIIVVVVAAFIGFGMWQDYKRNTLVQNLLDAVHAENKAVRETVQTENKWVREVIEKVGCHVQFNTWIGRIPRDAAIDWHSLPDNLYGCIPESLTGKRR